MCGLTASYSLPPNEANANVLEAQLQESIAKLNHRGPDSHGTYVSDDGRVGLGHARLSIIDVEGGAQPLHTLEGDVHAIVNGELYDYAELRQDLEKRGRVFQTFSDSELVVHLYKIHGLNLVQFLRGEFAFVLYDSERKMLFAARDRFGIKPLYYTFSHGRLLVASEMKALMAYGWKAEWDVQSIIEGGEFNDNRTVFKGVYKVPAAHHLTFTRTGQLKIQPWWEHPFPDQHIPETRSIEEIIQGLRARMIDAVRVRLRSDVPLAISLSGGLDSSSVAGIASKLLREKDANARVATFTLAFPARGDVDEGPVARRMAESIGADIHMVTPTEADLVGILDKAVYHTELPVHTMHPSGRLILSEAIRAAGYKVTLTGEGSDEFQGGYSFVLADFLRAPDPASSKLGIPLPSPTELQSLLAIRETMRPPQEHVALEDVLSTDHALGRTMLGGISTPRFCASMSPPLRIMQGAVVSEFPARDRTAIIAEGMRPEARASMISGRWHPLHAALYTSGYLVLQWLLNVNGDRTEMGNSVEGRQPFLDHKMIEYIDMVPPSLKIMPRRSNDGEWTFTEKWVLREAMKPYITEEIYRRRKEQYNSPLSNPQQKQLGVANGVAVHNGCATAFAEKLLTPLQVYLQERVTQARVDKLGFFDWESIRSILDTYLTNPETPKDGGLDRNARILLCVSSFTVLQDRFEVPTAVF